MVFTCGMRASRRQRFQASSRSSLRQVWLYSMEILLLVTLGRDVQPALEFSHFIHGVIGSCDHALALTSLPGTTKAGPLPSSDLSIGVNSTMNPSDSRPARFPFAFGL